MIEWAGQRVDERGDARVVGPPHGEAAHRGRQDVGDAAYGALGAGTDGGREVALVPDQDGEVAAPGRGAPRCIASRWRNP